MIELIMVIAIVGILSSIFYSKATDSISGIRLMAAAEKLKDDICYIYNLAVTHHDTTWLVVDMDNQLYGLYSGPTALTRQVLIDPSTNESAIVNLSDSYPGVEFTTAAFGGSSEFYFDWWGTPSAGGTVVINETKTILVTPETGFTYEN